MGGQMQDNGPWAHCTGRSKLLYDIPLFFSATNTEAKI